MPPHVLVWSFVPPSRVACGHSCPQSTPPGQLPFTVIRARGLRTSISIAVFRFESVKNSPMASFLEFCIELAGDEGQAIYNILVENNILDMVKLGFVTDADIVNTFSKGRSEVVLIRVRQAVFDERENPCGASASCGSARAGGPIVLFVFVVRGSVGNLHVFDTPCHVRCQDKAA